MPAESIIQTLNHDAATGLYNYEIILSDGTEVGQLTYAIHDGNDPSPGLNWSDLVKFGAAAISSASEMEMAKKQRFFPFSMQIPMLVFVTLFNGASFRRAHQGLCDPKHRSSLIFSYLLAITPGILAYEFGDDFGRDHLSNDAITAAVAGIITATCDWYVTGIELFATIQSLKTDFLRFATGMQIKFTWQLCQAHPFLSTALASLFILRIILWVAALSFSYAAFLGSAGEVVTFSRDRLHAPDWAAAYIGAPLGFAGMTAWIGLFINFYEQLQHVIVTRLVPNHTKADLTPYIAGFFLALPFAVVSAYFTEANAAIIFPDITPEQLSLTSYAAGTAGGVTTVAAGPFIHQVLVNTTVGTFAALRSCGVAIKRLYDKITKKEPPLLVN